MDAMRADTAARRSPHFATAQKSAALPLAALAIAAFGIGTTEFGPMGMLLNIASGIDVSIPSAGPLVSAYANGVTLGAPVTTLLLEIVSMLAFPLLARTALPPYRTSAFAICPKVLSAPSTCALSGCPKLSRRWCVNRRSAENRCPGAMLMS